MSNPNLPNNPPAANASVDEAVDSAAATVATALRRRLLAGPFSLKIVVIPPDKVDAFVDAALRWSRQ
jgi:hypothetical protein